MTTTTRTRAAMFALTFAMCAACIVVATPAVPRGEVAFVVREPPPERIEIAPPPPTGEHVWAKGHWVWRGDDFEWIPGHWVRLEPGFREWEPGRWEREPRGWHYVEGHFVEVVYVNREPPPLREEVISARPSPAHIWVRGHWDWRGRDFEWITGHWVRPEHGLREWVPGRWEHESRGWFYIEGHWR